MLEEEPTNKLAVTQKEKRKKEKKN